MSSDVLPTGRNTLPVGEVMAKINNRPQNQGGVPRVLVHAKVFSLGGIPKGVSISFRPELLGELPGEKSFLVIATLEQCPTEGRKVVSVRAPTDSERDRYQNDRHSRMSMNGNGLFVEQERA
jgi:hypothetical protein